MRRGYSRAQPRKRHDDRSPLGSGLLSQARALLKYNSVWILISHALQFDVERPGRSFDLRAQRDVPIVIGYPDRESSFALYHPTIAKQRRLNSQRIEITY